MLDGVFEWCIPKTDMDVWVGTTRDHIQVGLPEGEESRGEGWEVGVIWDCPIEEIGGEVGGG